MTLLATDLRPRTFPNLVSVENDVDILSFPLAEGTRYMVRAIENGLVTALSPIRHIARSAFDHRLPHFCE